MAIYKNKPTLNGEGGTTVVANPTLEGTEPDLTGLEVSGTKFKVPQGGGGSTLGLKYQDTKDVVDFAYTDIYSKLTNTAGALTIYLDTSKLKQILIKVGVDLNQPFYDPDESDQGMESVNFIFTLSYTAGYSDEDAEYHLFKNFELEIYVYYSYGILSDIRIQDEKGAVYYRIDLTSVTGLTTWEDLLDWMIENNKNLTIGEVVSGEQETYWGINILNTFYSEYNWALYPTFSTVYIIDNQGDDPYRPEPLYVDIQDLKDALIYDYEE